MEAILTLAPFEVPGSSASSLLLGDHGYKKPQDSKDSINDKEEEDHYSPMMIDHSSSKQPSNMMMNGYGLRRPDPGVTGSTELWKKLMSQDATSSSSDVVKTRALVTGAA